MQIAPNVKSSAMLLGKPNSWRIRLRTTASAPTFKCAVSINAQLQITILNSLRNTVNVQRAQKLKAITVGGYFGTTITLVVLELKPAASVSVAYFVLLVIGS